MIKAEKSMAEQLDMQQDVQSEEVLSDEDKSMSKPADVIYCGPCLEDEEHNGAEGFCVDCDDYLCSGCYTAHRKSKTSRHHNLKGKSEMPLNKQCLQTNKHELKMCAEHKYEILDYYCHSHDSVLCKLCKSIDHRHCTNIEALDIVCKDSTKVEGVRKVKEELGCLLAAVEDNMNNARENKVDIETYHQAAIEGLRVIRDKDLLMMRAIENACLTVGQQITTMRNAIVSSEKDKCLAFLVALANKSQMITLKERVASIKSDNKIAKYRFVPASTSDFSTDQLGIVKTIPSKAEEIVVDMESDKTLCYITGIAKISDRKLVLADHSNKKIKLFDLQSKAVVSELALDMTPWDLTKIDDRRIALTTLDNKKILIVAISEKLTIENVLSLDGFSQCDGIIFKDNLLIVSCYEPDQIQILDLEGTIKQTINGTVDNVLLFNGVLYIAQGPDINTIYLSENTNDKIVKMTLDGEIQASFTHELLKGPRGITVGRDGRVFVCCDKSNNIHEISSDLSKGQVIFEEKDGISDSEAIVYIEEEHKLYVGSHNNNAIQEFLV